MPRTRSFPVTMRPEARTAALMLSTVQSEGEESPRKKGLQFWVNDLIDAVVCSAFKETFGISVGTFQHQYGRRKRIPRDPQLRAIARQMLAHKFAAVPGEQ